jgi:hypothetical protein
MNNVEHHDDEELCAQIVDACSIHFADCWLRLQEKLIL